MRSLFILIFLSASAPIPAIMPDASNYGSIQEALDKNPGKVVQVPQETCLLQEPIKLATSGSGLAGYGTIVQENGGKALLIIENVQDIRVSGLTFTRPEASPECDAPGITLRNCADVRIEDIRLLDNRSAHGGIRIENCSNCRVTGCEVRNYKRIAIDDRTSAEATLYGYAFPCIDGTGIVVNESREIDLLDNRIVEYNLLPTRENKECYQLGSLAEGRHPTQPGALGQDTVRGGYASNWHQGSAIVVTGPETTRDILIRGNYIENCAQGIDLHCDYARITDNTVKCGMAGIKMTHGSKHLLVTGNLLTRIDLWAILYNPGAASHAARPASETGPALSENVDGGSIIANNLITDYGYGNEYWNWGGATADQSGAYAIALYEGQLPENPPLSEVLVTGNLVCHGPGNPEGEPPRYRYALYCGPWGGPERESPNLPRNITITGNTFHPGSAGISNIDLAAEKQPVQ